MDYGFVYLLGNRSMAGLIKIGMTERSPHLRAAELSRGTGVPSQFFVYGYVETGSMRELEKQLHSDLSPFRVRGKEFFKVDFAVAWEALQVQHDWICSSLCVDGAIALQELKS